MPESNEVFEAKNFGASAVQVDYEGSFLKHHRQSEDCLTLNICVGNKGTERKKPVIVIFHHGDFTYGGAADPLLHGDPMFTYSTPEASRNLAKKLLQATATTTMADLMRLSTEQLKDAQQKLVMDLSAPTRDGKMIPFDFYDAYRDGAASGIEFIIGIPGNERQIYKSIVGDKKYEDFISKELDDILIFLDNNYPDEAKAVRDYIAEQTATISALDANAKAYEQFYTLSTYRCAQKLTEGGNKVRLLYWNVKPLIENLGSGTVDVLATFCGSREAVQLYGNVLNRDIAETLQKLFRKFERGDDVRLFNNEIKGISAIDWKEFPQALIVSEKVFTCEQIADRLTEVDGLTELLAE